MQITFVAPVVRWKLEAATWWLAFLPRDAADEVRFAVGAMPKNRIGSWKVEARLGESVWRTSIFPNKDTQSYLLPVKGAIRKAENVQESDELSFQITLLEV